ncbi:MAG: PAS domain S-box protein [Methanoregulaceae archaeon]
MLRNLLKEQPEFLTPYLLPLLVGMAMFAFTGAVEIVMLIYFPGLRIQDVLLIIILLAGIGAGVIAFFSLRSLLRTEVRLDAILNGSPALQFVIDTDHRVLYWNHAMEIQTGIRAADVVGTTDSWKAVYPEKRPLLADLLLDGDIEKLPEWYKGNISRSHILEGAYETVEYFPAMGKDGSWMYFTAVPVKGRTGKVIGAVETLIDITDRVKADIALHESKDRFLVFIKEAAMRLKTPIEVVEENLALVMKDIEGNETGQDEILLQVTLQIRNLEQIRKNLIELNATITEQAGALSEGSRRLLME